MRGRRKARNKNPRSTSLNKSDGLLVVVHLEVVHHDHLAFMQARNECLLNIRAKGQRIGHAREFHGGGLIAIIDEATA